MAPRPASKINLSEPTSTSVLGPKRSNRGGGAPVPRRVTRKRSCGDSAMHAPAIVRKSILKNNLANDQPHVLPRNAAQQNSNANRQASQTRGSLRLRPQIRLSVSQITAIHPFAKRHVALQSAPITLTQVSNSRRARRPPQCRRPIG